jgi:hypothetical protein
MLLCFLVKEGAKNNFDDGVVAFYRRWASRRRGHSAGKTTEPPSVTWCDGSNPSSVASEVCMGSHPWWLTGGSPGQFKSAGYHCSDGRALAHWVGPVLMLFKIFKLPQLVKFENDTS